MVTARIGLGTLLEPLPKPSLTRICSHISCTVSQILSRFFSALSCAPEMR
jgi:hypothetical protein